MKIITAIFMLMVMTTVATAAPADEATLAKVVEALEKPFQQGSSGKQIRDFQGDFAQKSRTLDRVQTAQGRLSVRFPGGADAMPQFRWEYEQPEPSQIVSDGRTMWVYIPENRQVIRSDVKKAFSSQGGDPFLFLTGLGNLSKSFNIAAGNPATDSDGNFLLELKPKEPSPFIRSLSVIVRKEALTGNSAKAPVFPLLATTVVDPNDNSTQIEFRKVRINRGLAAEHFQFVVPEGVDVVESFGQGMGF